MSFDTSLFDTDAGYYEFLPNQWMPGKIVPPSPLAWPQRAIDAAVNVDLEDSDVIMATYPKTGQTWTMTIIYYMMHAKQLEEGKEVEVDKLFQLIPFIESEDVTGRTGADIFRSLPSPRYVKTHLPYQLWKKQLEKHPKLKIIQTIRNPKDTLVSFYHFIQNDQFGGFNGTWDQYFELVKQKKLPWGDYFQHHAEWYKFNKDRKESLILFYEDMKKSHRDHVVKIAKFLGYDFSDKLIDIIVQKTSLKDMSVSLNGMVKKLAPGTNPEKPQFVRKGQVGDWVNYFSEEQSKFVETKCLEYLKPLGLEFKYKI